MELSTIKPTTEATSISASALQDTRFNERRQREAQSDVRTDVVYFSPVIRIDTETNSAILQYRDSSTGKVKNEFPAKQISNYQQAQDLEQEETAQAAVSIMIEQPVEKIDSKREKTSEDVAA